MVNNIADTIEEYILQQLAEQQDGKVELKRTELADKISCAPSQISYVLSTRFTEDRGFAVESRRGLGGYIRITILESADIKNLIYKDMIDKINEDTDFGYVHSMINYLVEHKMITKREAMLSMNFVLNLYDLDTISDEQRVALLHAMFSTMSKF